MRTILEWYQYLPEDIRAKAIAAYDPEFNLKNKINSLADAILYGFKWDEDGYWLSIHKRAQAGSFPKSPDHSLGLDNRASLAATELEQLKDQVEYWKNQWGILHNIFEDEGMKRVECEMQLSQLRKENDRLNGFLEKNGRPGKWLIMAGDLCDLYQEYIYLLSDEIESMVGIATANGWKSKNHKKGEAIRKKILNKRNELNGASPERSHEDPHSELNKSLEENAFVTELQLQAAQLRKERDEAVPFLNRYQKLLSVMNHYVKTDHDLTHYNYELEELKDLLSRISK